MKPEIHPFMLILFFFQYNSLNNVILKLKQYLVPKKKIFISKLMCISAK